MLLSRSTTEIQSSPLPCRAKRGGVVPDGVRIYSAHEARPRTLQSVAIRVRSVGGDLSRQSVYRDGCDIHSGRIASDGRADGMGVQRVHAGLCHFRNSERLARRYGRTEKSSDANSALVVDIHDGNRGCVELPLTPGVSVPVWSRRGRRIS